MPTLKQLTCKVVNCATKQGYKEVSVSYGDGVVNCHILVPDGRSEFTIKLESEGYIAPGLAMFAYIDGVYQSNRNQCNLKLPASGESMDCAEVKLELSQREAFNRDGSMIVSSWMIYPVSERAPDQSRSKKGISTDASQLSTIEVLVLRCGQDEDDSNHLGIFGRDPPPEILEPFPTRGSWRYHPEDFGESLDNYAQGQPEFGASTSLAPYNHQPQQSSSLNWIAYNRQMMAFTRRARDADPEAFDAEYSRLPEDVHLRYTVETPATTQQAPAQPRAPLPPAIQASYIEATNHLADVYDASNKTASHALIKGKPYSYVHATRTPKYIDTLKAPYAKFVFHYHDRASLERIIGPVDTSLEDAQKEFAAKSKDDLIQELVNIRKKGAAPAMAAPASKTVHWDSAPTFNAPTPGTDTSWGGGGPATNTPAQPASQWDTGPSTSTTVQPADQWGSTPSASTAWGGAPDTSASAQYAGEGFSQPQNDKQNTKQDDWGQSAATASQDNGWNSEPAVTIAQDNNGWSSEPAATGSNANWGGESAGNNDNGGAWEKNNTSGIQNAQDSCDTTGDSGNQSWGGADAAGSALVNDSGWGTQDHNQSSSWNDPSSTQPAANDSWSAPNVTQPAQAPGSWPETPTATTHAAAVDWTNPASAPVVDLSGPRPATPPHDLFNPMKSSQEQQEMLRRYTSEIIAQAHWDAANKKPDPTPAAIPEPIPDPVPGSGNNDIESWMVFLDTPKDPKAHSAAQNQAGNASSSALLPAADSNPASAGIADSSSSGNGSGAASGVGGPSVRRRARAESFYTSASATEVLDENNERPGYGQISTYERLIADREARTRRLSAAIAAAGASGVAGSGGVREDFVASSLPFQPGEAFPAFNEGTAEVVERGRTMARRADTVAAGAGGRKLGKVVEDEDDDEETPKPVNRASLDGKSPGGG